MVERYTEHVSTESPELIRANECEYNIGTLVTYRFRRLWNEIVDLREQLDATRRTTPGSEFEFTDGVSSYTVHGDKKAIDALLRWKMNQQRITENALKECVSRTTPDREAIIEECAKEADYFSAASGVARNIGNNIRALKAAPTPAQPFSLTEDDPQEGVAFQYAHELVAKRLRGDKGGAR